MTNEQIDEVSGLLTAFTLLGIAALGGMKWFAPLWLICAVIYLYHVMSNFLLLKIDSYPLFLLEFAYFTIISPFWFFMAIYRLLVIFIEVWWEVRNGNKKQT